MKGGCLSVSLIVFTIGMEAQTIDNLALAHTLYEQDEMELYEFYLAKAGNEGNVNAQLEMARLCDDYRYSNAIDWYEAAANQKNRDAMKRLVEIYSLGGTFKDSVKAKYWLTELSRQHDADLVLFLGDLNMSLRNYTKAAELYAEALDFGEAKGVFGLFMVHFRKMTDSEIPNGQADSIMALEMCTKAAELNCAEAQFALSDCYYKGILVSLDKGKGLYWLKKAAEHNKASAQYELARLYGEGMMIPEDQGMSDYWLNKSAELGDTIAIMRLGHKAELEDSLQLAAHHYLRAARNGSSQGMHGIGYAYLRGQGVGENYKKAKYWLQRGANKGNKDCLYCLGLMLCWGDRYGLETNKELGLKYLEAAKRMGHEWAAEFLEGYK